MNNAEKILMFSLRVLGYKNKQDMLENLYLQALSEAFVRIQNVLNLEEKIRDAFIYDLENNSPIISGHLKDKTVILTWEKWINLSDTEKSRADICFSISGFEFVLECKLLDCADKRYLEEGIKRFVELKYAEDDSFAGMLGFITKGNPKRIVTNLKKKVTNFHPSNAMEDFIDKKCLDHELSFQSKHKRINDTEIHLYHLFFDLREAIKKG